jgi:hypothetical protein
VLVRMRPGPSTRAGAPAARAASRLTTPTWGRNRSRHAFADANRPPPAARRAPSTPRGPRTPGFVAHQRSSRGGAPSLCRYPVLSRGTPSDTPASAPLRGRPPSLPGGVPLGKPLRGAESDRALVRGGVAVRAQPAKRLQGPGCAGGSFGPGARLSGTRSPGGAPRRVPHGTQSRCTPRVDRRHRCFASDVWSARHGGPTTSPTWGGSAGQAAPQRGARTASRAPARSPRRKPLPAPQAAPRAASRAPRATSAGRPRGPRRSPRSASRGRRRTRRVRCPRGW